MNPGTFELNVICVHYLFTVQDGRICWLSSNGLTSAVSNGEGESWETDSVRLWTRQQEAHWALWGAVRMWRGAGERSEVPNTWREKGEAERRRHQVRRGDMEVAGGLAVTWVVTAGWDQSRGPGRDRRKGVVGGQRVTPKEGGGGKGLIPFPVHYRGMFSAGWDVSPPPPAAALLGPKLAYCRNTGPLVSGSPNHPHSAGVSQQTDRGRQVDLHVSSWEISVIGRRFRASKKRLFSKCDKEHHSPGCMNYICSATACLTSGCDGSFSVDTWVTVWCAALDERRCFYRKV